MNGDVTAIRRPDLIHVDTQIALDTVPLSYRTTLKYFSRLPDRGFRHYLMLDSLDELLPRLPARSARRGVPPVIHKRCGLRARQRSAALT